MSYRPLTVSAMLTLLLLGCSALSGCGSGTREGSSTVPSQTSGEVGLFSFGHAADGGTLSAIAGAVEGYSAALAAGDGKAACGYLVAPLAHQVAANSADDCVTALTRLYSSQSAAARAALGKMQVSEVRVRGEQAFAIIGHREGFFPVQYAGGEWRIAALGVSDLP